MSGGVSVSAVVLCLEEYGPQSGKEINAGVAPYLAARDMSATNRVVGKVSALQDAAQPSSLDGPGFKLLKQSSTAAYSIYQVSNAAAAEFECDPKVAFEDYDQAPHVGSRREVWPLFRLRLSPESAGREERRHHLAVDEGRQVLESRLVGS